MKQDTGVGSVAAALRKGNASAIYRIKNAMRVNKAEYLCVPSGLFQQAKEIRQALAAARPSVIPATQAELLAKENLPGC